MTLIVEGVERDLNVVVIRRSHRFAPRQVSANRVRISIPADPNQVQVRRVIAHVNIGALSGGLAVGWKFLDEVCDLRQLRRIALGCHLREILQAWRVCHARDLDPRCGAGRVDAEYQENAAEDHS